MGDRSDAQRAQAGQVARRAAEERIGAEPPEKLRMVVVERETEAESLGASVTLGQIRTRPSGS